MQIGAPGHAGEYEVQEGFGWTNGVLLYFLSKYGDLLSYEDNTATNPVTRSKRTHPIFAFILFIGIFTIALMWSFLQKKRYRRILLLMLAISSMMAFIYHVQILT